LVLVIRRQAADPELNRWAVAVMFSGLIVYLLLMCLPERWWSDPPSDSRPPLP
jgi:hypothetical protein